MSRYILYDYLQVAGGAERLTLDLMTGLQGYEMVISRIYPTAGLLASLKSVDAKQIRCLGTRMTKLFPRVPEAVALFKYGTGFLRDAELVLYSGLYAPFAVTNQRYGKRVYYCHTPPRYAYDLKERYLRRVPAIARPAAALAIASIRQTYETSIGQMDRIIANSVNVQRRLKCYLGVDAEVVYPPIDTDRFKWAGQQDYFISLARLEPQKRVDLIIQAFRLMPEQKLVVASGGSEEGALRKLAAGASNIFFTGWQTEAGLRELLGNARAAIYVPLDEDFGMSAVEAMSAGKPVVGVADGGLVETVIDRVTGILIPQQLGVESIVDGVLWMTAERALGMRTACEDRAMRFSKAAFIDRMKMALGA